MLEVSPHTRGWTHREGSPQHQGVGFPAHAGMDPRRQADQGGRRRFPRTRGDGPDNEELFEVGSAVSPHTRGWTSRSIR